MVSERVSVAIQRSTKEHKETFGRDELGSLLLVVIVSILHIYVKTYQIVHLCLVCHVN